MHFAALTTTTFALLGSTLAAPLAEPEPVTLPAPASVQQQIITLQNQIVYLANDIVQSNAANAKKDFSAGLTQFTTLGKAVLIPAGYACPPITANGRPTEKNTVLEFLQDSQSSLQDLSLKLQTPLARPKKINADFCSALADYRLVQYYATDLVGTKPSSLVSALAAAPVFDLTRFESTYLNGLIALEALIAALNTAGADAKTAMRSAQVAIANYETAAVLRRGECAQYKTAAPTSAKEAMKQVQTIETDVQKAFADKKALNGKAFDDFCRIDAFVVSVNSFVGA